MDANKVLCFNNEVLQTAIDYLCLDTEDKLKMLILAPLVRVMEEQVERNNWISATGG